MFRSLKNKKKRPFTVIDKARSSTKNDDAAIDNDEDEDEENVVEITTTSTPRNVTVSVFTNHNGNKDDDDDDDDDENDNDDHQRDNNSISLLQQQQQQRHKKHDRKNTRKKQRHAQQPAVRSGGGGKGLPSSHQVSSLSFQDDLSEDMHYTIATDDDGDDNDKKNMMASKNNNVVRNQSKSRKRGGIGFGGSTTTNKNTTTTTTSMSYNDDNNKDEIDDDDDDDDDNNKKKLYSKASLSKLLQEQKQQLQKQQQKQTPPVVPMAGAGIISNKNNNSQDNPSNDEDDDHSDSTTELITSTVYPDLLYQNMIQLENEAEEYIHHRSRYDNMENDYIPLPQESQYNNPEQILTGDAALVFMEQQQQQQQQNANETLEDDETTNNAMYHPVKLVPTESHINDDDNNHRNTDEITTHADEWENEVIRRAGVDVQDISKQQEQGGADGIVSSSSISYEISSSANNSNTSANDVKNNNNNPRRILNQLQTQITTTVEQIQQHQIDIERQNQRRQNDIQSIEQLLILQQGKLATVDSAHQFYQKWKTQYITWMGAMHALQPKVFSIMISLHQLEQDIAAGIQSHEFYDQDIIVVLNEYNVVKDIIGTPENVVRLQKLSTVDEAEGHVDEFGRSIVSQSKIQREKRRLQRRRTCEQHYQNRNLDQMIEDTTMVESNFSKYVLRGDEADGFVCDEEMEAYRERHEALQGALIVAINEINEDYVTLHKLMDFFTEWYDQYPDEYMSSPAGNTLIDMATVLIQAELCSLNDPWNESGGYNESKWMTVIHTAMNHNLLTITHIERLFTKCIIPSISDLLLNNGLNMLSSRQTRSLHAFLIHLQKLLPATNSTWMKLWDFMKSYLSQSLETITIVTIDVERLSLVTESTTFTDTISNNTNKNDEFEEAVYSATLGQLYRIQKILSNIFQYWQPLLRHDSDFRATVIQFITKKFIRLVMSVHMIKRLWQHGRFGLVEFPSDVFQHVYTQLLKTKWLDLPEYADACTIIQGTALIFQMESEF